MIALVALAACTTGNTAATSTTSANREASTTVASTTTVDTMASTTSSLAPTTTSTVSTTTTSTVELPSPKLSLEHGGDAWAVYLAISSDLEDPALTAASLLLADLGYPSGSGDLGCDVGGHQTVGRDPGEQLTAVAVYFETPVEAARFVVALDEMGQTMVGLGLVQTYCLD